MTEANSQRRRVGLVLSGGGARGAYEAGVLAHLFEEIYPQLPPGFEFDVLSGTSVGAIHAAYVAASAHMEPAPRTRRLADTWRNMRVNDVLQLSAGDLFGIPLRALGMTRLGKRLRAGAEVIGGLVDIAPLERLVAQRIPWDHLRANLERGTPGALCVSCTQVRTGRVNVFMEGPLADPHPWEFDPNTSAEPTELSPLHVRASAAIPFFFPAVRIGERYYLDGGLRVNTPLSPALRLGLVNALIEHGRQIYGGDFLGKLNVAVRAHRGADYRDVNALTLRPSQDVGVIAAESYDRQSRRSMGILPALLTRVAQVGVPKGEAYLLFDRCFTKPLMELGREDAKAQSDAIVELLSG